MRFDGRRWASTGGGRVLIVAPHPDDEIAGAGGTLLLHLRAGDQVMVVHVTDGRGSRAQGLGPDAMAGRRRTEAEAALAGLGVSRWDWLGLREWEWEDAAAIEALGRALAIQVPDVVYAPSRVDFHPEHHRVARALAAALAAAPRIDPVVRIYQVQVPLTRVLVNLVAPIGAVLDQTRRAAQAYATQQGSLRSCFRLKRYAAWSRAIPGAAEEFWELAPGAYIALHPPKAETASHHMFRGLRRFPITDPLAFAVGRAERRRLRALAAAWRPGA